MNAPLSPAFLVTAALSTVGLELNAWANVAERRAYFEAFAAIVIARAALPATEQRAVVAREVRNVFFTDRVFPFQRATALAV